MPNFFNTKYAFTYERVNKLIENGVPHTLSAKVVPSQPKENLAFLIDKSFLENWKDVFSDDMGVWNPSGTKTFYFSKTFDRNGSVTVNTVIDETRADFMAKGYTLYIPFL